MWRDKSWRIQSERYPIHGRLKSKGLLKLYSAFEGIQEPFGLHVRVLPIKPCLHTQLPEHNRSHWKVSRGWRQLITWNGPMMGHLNSQGSYTFLRTEFKAFSRPLFFIFQTQGNSEILYGPRENNCLNYENIELKTLSFSCLILNLQWHNQNIAVY